MLGLARALGETMAVQMVIGNSQGAPSWNILGAATTIPATIVQQFPDATGLPLSALFELALLLLIITMSLNVFARLLVWSVTRKYAQ